MYKHKHKQKRTNSVGFFNLNKNNSTRSPKQQDIQVASEGASLIPTVPRTAVYFWKGSNDVVAVELTPMSGVLASTVRCPPRPEKMSSTVILIWEEWAVVRFPSISSAVLWQLPEFSPYAASCFRSRSNASIPVSYLSPAVTLRYAIFSGSSASRVPAIQSSSLLESKLEFALFFTAKNSGSAQPKQLN